MNNTTRRYPRTMQEAFGPYTNRELSPKPAPAEPLTLAHVAYPLALIGVLAWLLIF